MSDFVTISSWAWALGLVGLALAGLTYRYVTGQASGSDAMGELAEQIHDGSMAFLRREYSMLAIFVAVVAALLAWAVSVHTAAAYLVGALCSVMAGFFGMKSATRANVRTSAAANEDGAGKALRVAFFGGAVMGLCVVALGDTMLDLFIPAYILVRCLLNDMSSLSSISEIRKVSILKSKSTFCPTPLDDLVFINCTWYRPRSRIALLVNIPMTLSLVWILLNPPAICE